jgi:heptosyltransferase-2
VTWSSIVVRAPNWLGDAVMALPAVRALRQRCPDARLAVAARAGVADLYRREPCCDEVRIYPAGRLARVRVLRGFDAAFLLTNSFESALAARLAGISERIGYDRDGRGLLLTRRIEPPRPGKHESLYYLELLHRAGIFGEAPSFEPITLHAACEARGAGRERFAQMGFRAPVIGVSPGAQNSRAKQWPAERFFEAAMQIAAQLGADIAVFGSTAERALCQALAEAVRRAGRRVLNLAGETSLAAFIEMAAACAAFLTNDSGAMHVASAAGVPTVAIFGPTEWFATAPSGPLATIVREPVECSPCMLRDCPIDHRCMMRIAPERVAQAALELLK